MRKIILALLFLVYCAQSVTTQTRSRNPQPQTQQASSQPSPTPVDNRQTEIDNAAKAERERYEKERDAKEEAFKAEQLRQNGIIVKATFWMAVFAGINLLVAGVYAVFAYRTLKAVDKEATHAGEQVTKMGEGIAQTQDLITQNAEMATAVQGQLTVMQDTLRHDKEVFEKTIEREMEESRNTLKQLHLMELQANISNTQMEIAAEAAKTTQGQLEEMVRQNKRLEESDARERAKTDPRLRIAEVRVVNLRVGEEPTFIVTIVNDGFVDAPEVKFGMSVEFGEDKTLTLNDAIFPVAAREKEFQSITSVSRLTQTEIDGFNGSVPLIVRGHIDFWTTGPKPFCFKFQPWPQGEDKRPEGVRQFIPCERQTTLNIGVRVKGVEAKVTMGTVGVVIKKATPEETKPEEKTDPEGEDEG